MHIQNLGISFIHVFAKLSSCLASPIFVPNIRRLPKQKHNYRLIYSMFIVFGKCLIFVNCLAFLAGLSCI